MITPTRFLEPSSTCRTPSGGAAGGQIVSMELSYMGLGCCSRSLGIQRGISPISVARHIMKCSILNTKNARATHQIRAAGRHCYKQASDGETQAKSRDLACNSSPGTALLWPEDVWRANSPRQWRFQMELLLIIVVLILLFGGGGGYYGRRRGYW